MSFVRGERVHFDFDTGQIDPVGASETNVPVREPATAAFVGEIFERAPTTSNPPAAPSLKGSVAGFPAPKKRTARVSAFKQQRTAKNEVSFTSQAHDAPVSSRGGDTLTEDERIRIDQENNQKLAEMSPEEIEEERRELLSSLSPSLIQRLLARSNIDDSSNERELFEEPPPAAPTNEVDTDSKPKTQSNKKVSFDTPEELAVPANEPPAPTDSTIQDPTSEPTSQLDQLPNSVHFPKPPQPPDLDPNSPSFLEDLHEKYFPNLPYDPSSLSWMTPIDSTDTTSPYHPSHTALNASELRFTFKGELLPPSKAREIPVSAGLHHHSEAPEAAGYTIPELAILARSAVPAQRCVAYQTLGRLLFRLGRGEFGVEDEKRDVDAPVQVAKNPNEEDEENEVAADQDAGSYIATGLWNCVEEGRVIETLTAEAARERGHLTAKTYAEEALWNWRRGGGRKRRAI